MTIVELQGELSNKLKECGFSNVKEMVRNYSTGKHSLEKAIEKADMILEAKSLKDMESRTKFTVIYKNNVTDKMKDEIFSKLEALGYTMILKDYPVGSRLDVKVWVANKGNEVIVYSGGSFNKQNNHRVSFFTEKEYNIIKEA